MSQTYNLSDLIQLYNEEGEIPEDLISQVDFSPEVQPSAHTLNNILNYSKALNIRPSVMIKTVELILN
jgi:hypothetical protein